MDQGIRMSSGHRIKLWLKQLIFLKIKSPIKWMSPYILRNSKLWMMFWRPSMKKHERRKSCRNQKEDFSDMVAENASKRKRKHDKDGKSLKKKDFKFLMASSSFPFRFPGGSLHFLL